MINVTCGVGSTGRICTDIAAELEKLGHEVKIAYGRDMVLQEHQKYAVRIGNNIEIKLHALASRIFDNAGFGSKFATKKFLKWAEEYNPDIIHLHNIHGYYINIELLFNYIKKANKKVIWTLHDCWAFTGHCTHFDYFGCEKWKKQCYSCEQLKEYPKSVFCDNSKKNYKKKKELFSDVPNMMLVVPSEWLSGVVKQGFMGQYPVRVIPNGIDLSIFKPTESDIRQRYALQDKKILLGVSSVWTKKKGFYDFIELSKLISDDYRIVLVGVTDEQVKVLPQNVIGISRTNSITELCKWYTAADLFINPSVEETMGLTTAEALACGTPVIVYNRTAVPEVPDEKCGIVLKNNMPQEIFRCVIKCSFESADCIERARNFEKKNKYQEYINLYGLDK